MAYALTNRAPSASDLTAKNRVWDFFDSPNKTRPANRRQPLQLRRKNRPAPTKTVSGIPYWPSRDPIEERGGVNLYGFGPNSPINGYDLLGNGWFGDFWSALGNALDLGGKEAVPPIADGENMKDIAAGLTCVQLKAKCDECMGEVLQGKKCVEDCEDICQKSKDCADAATKGK